MTHNSGWLEPLKESVNSLLFDHILTRSCDIYLVPEGLKKCNVDAYIPRVVSIGPRFIGRKELLPMEEVKLKCMTSLLCRASVDQIGSLVACGEAIDISLNDYARASYAPDIVELGKLSDPELAKIMLVDGCFLLELLISKGLDSDFPSSLFPPGPTAELINNDDVLSDLMLFENQIPILILSKLSKILFPQVFGPDPEGKWSSQMTVCDLVLDLYGYSRDELMLEPHLAPNILDHAGFFVNRTGESTNKPPTWEEDHYHLAVDINDATQSRKLQQLKLKRCALRLLTAGVTIKVKKPENKDSTVSCFSLVWSSLCSILFWLSNLFVVKDKHIDDIPKATCLDFNFRFKNRKLEIEQLHITKTTKAKWCNLIAWEHHRKRQDIKNQETNSHAGCNSICAALIFNGLICSVDDVQFLKDKKIVVDHMKMSNQKLMELFREIALGVDRRAVDSRSYYVQMVNDINNISKANLIKRIWSMVWNSFTYRQEWLLRFMNHNYNFVATVISLCTVVQTIYTIISYQLPK